MNKKLEIRKRKLLNDDEKKLAKREKLITDYLFVKADEDTKLIQTYNIKECSVDIKKDLDNISKTDISDKNNEANEKISINIENVDIVKDRTVCEQCHKSIANSYYKFHLSLHKKVIRCDKCDRKFTTRCFKTHKCKLRFYCEPCSKNYPSQEKLDTHLRMHAILEKRKLKPQVFFCAPCSKNIKRICWKKHCLWHESLCKCERCGLELSEQSMKTHLNLHKKYDCKLCGKTSTNKTDSTKHKCSDCPKRMQSAVSCKECTDCFKTTGYLARHVSKTHRQLDSAKIECPICHKIVISINHHLQVHEISSNQCTKCQSILPNRSAFKSHTAHHRVLENAGRDRPIIPKHILDAESRSRRCMTCLVTFPCEDDLCRHNMLRHVYLLPCPFCTVHFSGSVVELIKHIRLNHEEVVETPNKCHLCPKIVLTDDLEKHVQRHRLPIYECDICGQAFYDESDYKRHFRKIHRHKMRKKNIITLIEQYSKKVLISKKVGCLQCDNTKIRISHISSHLKRHKNIKCSACNKVFFDEDLFKLHETKHSNKTISKRCSICFKHFLSHIRLLAHRVSRHKLLN